MQTGGLTGGLQYNQGVAITAVKFDGPLGNTQNIKKTKTE